MHKNLALFLLALLVVVAVAAGLAVHSRMSEELSRARARADASESRALKVEAQVAELGEKLRAANEQASELPALRNQLAELRNQVADLKIKTAPIDDNLRFGNPFAANREAARAFGEMIARNDAKLAELAKDAEAAARLQKLAALAADEKKAELERLQKIGDAITIDNEIIPLGTPGLDDKLRQLLLDQINQMPRGRRYGGGRRYEPPPAPPETNDLKF